MARLFTILICILALAACSSAPKQHTQDSPTKANSKVTGKTTISNQQKAKSALIAQHKEWQGTRYKMGGLSKKGVDCSGFVYLTFKERFGIHIPRSTKLQAETGTQVKRSHLRVGDLVFFKTARKVRHVGIYMGDNAFLHASTSRGVMISKLDNPYWDKHYWKAVRV